MVNYFEETMKTVCPVCRAEPDAVCRTARGVGLYGKPHKERIKVARLRLQGKPVDKFYWRRCDE